MALEKAAYQPFFVSNLETFQTFIRHFKLDTFEISSSNNLKGVASTRSEAMNLNDLEASLEALEQQIGGSKGVSTNPSLQRVKSSIKFTALHGRDNLFRSFSE